MPAALIAWLVFGFLAIVGLHEWTHVLIARWNGHPCVCIAVNPIGVALVFEDSPRPRYWVAQVILPALVSWVVCYAWLYVALMYPSNLQANPATRTVLDLLPVLVTLLTVLTSGGDLLSAIIEVRTPVHGDARIVRGFQVLRRLPCLVIFTAHGRRRWQAVWSEEKAGTTRRRDRVATQAA